MPYIEGETLRDRIDREKQLPVDEALDIATAVANALHTAHEAGIIHRDIKPGNILLSRGEPLVADFGIALAVGAAGGGRLTETGLSIGTPYYMSPEQATGDQTVGPPSDTFALACVLYEMLVGEPPYAGSTAQAVLGKIIQGVPVSATAVRKSIPLNVDAAIRRALERIPADRFTDAHGFASALGNDGFRHGKAEAIEASSTSMRPVLLTAVVASLAGLTLGWGVTRSDPEAPLVTRQRLEAFGAGLERPIGTHVALAPDGSSMVFASQDGTGPGWSLWLKPRGSADADRLSGTESAKNPKYSPDAEWIAFQSNGQLKKRHLSDGTVVTLAEGLGTGETGLAWLDDGTIVYEPAGTMTLVRIPESGGGTPDTLAHFPGGNLASAEALPGARGLLVGLCTAPTCSRGMDLHVLDLERDSAYPLVAEAARGWYLPTGHLLYVRLDGTVLAAPMDLDALTLTGPGTPLIQGLQVVNSSAQLAVGAEGTIVYLEGTQIASERAIVWVDRDGQAEPAFPDLVGLIDNVALSPDETRIALSARLGSQIPQLWVKELPDGPLTRLTTDDGFSRRPFWTRDSRSIVYVTNEAGPYEVRTLPADGSTAGVYELLVGDRSGTGVSEAGLTANETGLIVRSGDATTGLGDIGFVDLGTGEINDSLLATPFNERAVSLSPDGRWMIYVSNVSGQDEIFVRPFPEATPRISVSTGGGTNPVWGRGGNALYYIDGEQWMVEARYRATDSGFIVSGRDRLFDASPSFQYSPDWRRFDVTADGQRFLMLQASGTDGYTSGPVLTQNFFEEVKARVGG